MILHAHGNRSATALSHGLHNHTTLFSLLFQSCLASPLPLFPESPCFASVFIFFFVPVACYEDKRLSTTFTRRLYLHAFFTPFFFRLCNVSPPSRFNPPAVSIPSWSSTTIARRQARTLNCPFRRRLPVPAVGCLFFRARLLRASPPLLAPFRAFSTPCRPQHGAPPPIFSLPFPFPFILTPLFACFFAALLASSRPLADDRALFYPLCTPVCPFVPFYGRRPSTDATLLRLCALPFASPLPIPFRTFPPSPYPSAPCSALCDIAAAPRNARLGTLLRFCAPVSPLRSPSAVPCVHRRRHRRFPEPPRVPRLLFGDPKGPRPFFHISRSPSIATLQSSSLVSRFPRVVRAAFRNCSAVPECCMQRRACHLESRLTGQREGGERMCL